MGKAQKIFWLSCLICLFCLRSVASEGAEITLTFAGNMPLAHHITKEQNYFAKLIEQRTNGQVKVKVYPAGQLYSDKDFMQALPAGAVDMAVVVIAQWTGLNPDFLFLSLPMFFNDREHMRRVVDGKEAREILEKDLEKLGVKLLFFEENGYSDFTGKQPLRTIADFKGKRIRSFGELEQESIKALGGAPSFLGASEIYMALQRGTIDGTITAIASMWSRKLYEVSPYITIINYGYILFPVLMNIDKWNSLSPDIQKTIMACAKETETLARKATEETDKNSIEWLSPTTAHRLSQFHLFLPVRDVGTVVSQLNPHD